MSLREDEQQEFSASEEGLANRPTLLGEIHLDFIWTWLLTSCDKKNGNFYWQKVWATFWVWAFIMMNDLTEYTENWLSSFFPAFYCQVKRQYKNLKVVAGEYFPCQKILIDHRSRSSPLTGRKCLSPTDCDTPHSLTVSPAHLAWSPPADWRWSGPGGGAGPGWPSLGLFTGLETSHFSPHFLPHSPQEANWVTWSGRSCSPNICKYLNYILMREREREREGEYFV